MKNELGKFLSVIRIVHRETLQDMAKRLNVSPAFLSAVETGKSSCPPLWAEKIRLEYGLTDAWYEKLVEYANETVKRVHLRVDNASHAQKECALTFSRVLADLNDDDIQAINEVLNRKR